MIQNLSPEGQRRFALFVYGIGFIFGLLVAIGAIWPDLEASLFDTSISLQGQTPLRCPVFLTPADGSGEVRATIVNPSREQSARVPVRARISDGYVTLMREVNVTVPLEPRERRTLTYEIYEDDVAYGRFIFVRVLAFRNPPYPGAQATCGVWWLNIPLFTGGQALGLLLLISLGSLGYSNYIWQRYSSVSPRSLELGQFLLVMTGLIVLAIFAGLMGWWLIGVVALALITLILAMFGLVIEHFVAGSQ
jgi:hypothetical protein